MASLITPPPAVDARAGSTQQLAEFIAAVSSAATEAEAGRAAVERAAETLDAPVAAIVSGGRLVASVGYAEGSTPLEALAAVMPGRGGATLDVPGVGPCAATAAMAEHPAGATFVVARPDRLTRDETGLLRGMARVAGMTMRMLQVLEAERAAREEQAALRRVATLVATVAAPEEVFCTVAEEVARLSRADVAAVLRYESDASAIVIGSWGDREQHLPIGARLALAGHGVAAVIRRTGRPARVARIAGPPGSVAAAFESARMQSGVGSPIVVDGRLWGVVIAARASGEPLPPHVERRIPAFTELVAIAIANAQARVDLRAVADEQAALRRVATLVARAAPPAAVFGAVAEEVGYVLATADFTMVARYDDDAVEVVGAWSRAGDKLLLGRRTPLGGRNVSTLVFESNQPARVDDLTEDASALGVAAYGTGMRSSAGAPIEVEGRLWGVVIVAASEQRALPIGIEHRLAEFTELVATAIANAQAREELDTLADEQAALRRMATLVARGEPPRAVFAAVAAEVGRLLPVDLTLIGRYGSGGTVTGVGGWSRAGDAVPVATTRVHLGGRNVTALVFETGRPARLESYDEATGAAADDARRRGLRSAVGAPIRVESRLWGIMLAASTHADTLPPSTEDRLARFTELVGTAIAKAEAHGELMRSRARIVAGADEVRRRIERNLHDGAQQRLLFVALKLRAALADMPGGMDDLAAELEGIVDELNKALDELRELARGIHPAVLTEGGLPAALRALARRCAVPVRLDLRVEGRLPETVEVAAYFVASEALANAVKHADASKITVEVDARDAVLLIRIRDDGVGGADYEGGSGLVGLKDRVEALGGRIVLESAPGRGTSVAAELPVDGHATA
jgi:signal transduction histidine kinase